MTVPTPCILTTKAQFTKQIDFTRTKFTCQVTKHLYLPTTLTPGPIVVKSLFSGIQNKNPIFRVPKNKVNFRRATVDSFLLQWYKIKNLSITLLSTILLLTD